ncbi:MAG: GAF domain-containing SpoIIE family protein phosphatase [Bacteroidota bacterium]
MKIRRFISVGSALLLLGLVLAADVVRRNVDLDIGWLGAVRDLMIIAALTLGSVSLDSTLARRDATAVRRLAIALIATVVTGVLAVTIALSVDLAFDAKDFLLLPLNYQALFGATVISTALGLYAALLLRILVEFVLYKRRKAALRILRVFLIVAAASALQGFFLRPLEAGVVSAVLFGLGAALAAANSFRLSWIVYLSRREKFFSLVFSLLLFLGLLGMNVALAGEGSVSQAVLFWSHPVARFVSLVLLFGNIYFGMAFVSALFHLPTADAFDRKITEVSSLHTLSRLVTQAFDFDKLAGSVTSMTLQVCEAQSSWLEVIQTGDRGGPDPRAGVFRVRVAGLRNITPAEIDRLFPPEKRGLRELVMEQRSPLVVDDVARDERFGRVQKAGLRVGSLVMVPLASHTGPVGFLYVTKDSEHGFFKDDVDAVSAFADQATIAIENSRLISTSLERERLLREMMLAAEMQRRLLPQTLPRLGAVELDAVSTPAFEVGGDYYDFLQLDANRLGIVVGDVSGKGISAAFYMSEVKGIFQSLGRLYPSPAEFMVRANEALGTSIDKHSFITLLYAVLDVASGTLTLARAGHCPMLHVSGSGASYVRPPGMGLGLSRDATFAATLREQTVRLRRGDVCVFYTDGVTEARKGDEEYGYDRLAGAAVRAAGLPAAGIRDAILGDIRAHVGQRVNDDDLTLVVLRWRGNSAAAVTGHAQPEVRP